jgi:quinol monooxygenase YgiN
MNAMQLSVLGASVLASSVSVLAFANETQGQYVQVAELEIDPAQLENYKAAVEEQVETAIREEPGVLVLYAVAENDNPARVRVFEIYRDVDAYKSHLESDHFKKYKATTDTMVKSLKLVRVAPIVLGAKLSEGASHVCSPQLALGAGKAQEHRPRRLKRGSESMAGPGMPRRADCAHCRRAA